MATEVVLVRHGQTEWTITGQHTGRTDKPLTEIGRQQAIALKAMLAGYDFTAVFSSPLSRAKETAELAGFAPLEIDDDLMEWDYGIYETRRTRDIRQEIPGWSIWTHEIIDGESIEALAGRCDRVIARTDAVEGAVAVFGHGHALRVLAARWLGLPPTAGAHFVFETAAISVLGWERENRALLHWNDCCHLRGDEHPY
jgi:probable phosphoglycerate mutase